MEGDAPNLSEEGVKSTGDFFPPPSPVAATPAAATAAAEGDGREYVLGLVEGPPLPPLPPALPLPLLALPPLPSDWSKERLLETAAVRNAGPTLSSMSVVGFFAFLPLSAVMVAVAMVAASAALLPLLLLLLPLQLPLLRVLLLRLVLRVVFSPVALLMLSVFFESLLLLSSLMRLSSM